MVAALTIRIQAAAIYARTPHVDPNDAAPFRGGVGFYTCFVFEIGFRAFVRHFSTVAVNIELPAVIDATDAAFLVSTVEK
jgi:hypothetical protein